MFSCKSTIRNALLLMFSCGLLIQHVGAAFASTDQPDDSLFKFVDKILQVDALAYKDESDQEIIESSKQRFREMAKYPESVQFKDIVLYRTSDKIYICGLARGKNSLRIYTRFAPFLSTPGGVVYTTYTNDGQLVLPKFCK